MIGAPVAGVTVAIRVEGLTPLITPVIVFSSFAAMAATAINERPRIALKAAVLIRAVIIGLRSG
jgi:hypothetical protein